MIFQQVWSKVFLYIADTIKLVNLGMQPVSTEVTPEKVESTLPQSLPEWLLKYFPALGFILGLFFWLIDACIDVYLIHPDESLVESLFNGAPTEMWMRTLVVIIMTVSAFFAQHLMKKQKNVEILLRDHKLHLEAIVEERTNKLIKMANIDPLTGIYNRRKFSENLDSEIQRSKRYHQPLSLIMCDVDHFKSVNDTYGHQAGDEVLIGIADVFKACLRNTDVYARWGGEEFIVLLAQTALEDAKLVAEKLRQQIANIHIKDNVQVTASFGVSCFDEDEDVSPLVKRADDALYEAKNNGRNRVSVLVAS